MPFRASRPEMQTLSLVGMDSSKIMTRKDLAQSRKALEIR